MDPEPIISTVCIPQEADEDLVRAVRSCKYCLQTQMHFYQTGSFISLQVYRNLNSPPGQICAEKEKATKKTSTYFILKCACGISSLKKSSSITY